MRRTCGSSIDPSEVRECDSSLSTAAALAALAAAFAAPGRRARRRAPGPQCGGTLWKLMTLSDTGKRSVNWNPAATTIADIAKLSRAGEDHRRRAATSFQKQVWKLTAVIERYRVASNGEIVLELYDIPTSTYMDAYMPAPSVHADEGAWQGADAHRAERLPQALPGTDRRLAAARRAPPTSPASASGTRSRRRRAR